MKKIFFLALVIVLFAGCVQPTIDVPSETKEETPVENPAPKTPTMPETPEMTAPYFVKNSKWELVDVSTLPARSVSLSLNQALEIVKTYNAEHDDDQLFLNTIDVPIEESPDVTIFIVNEGDYFEFARYTISRAEFTERRRDYELDAAGFGGLLFVDKVPPVPIVIPDTRTREEKYALYMINKYDKIVVYNGYKYEQHIDQIWDSLTDDVKAGYDNDIDKLMASRVSGFEMEIRGVGLVPPDTPWRVVSGSIHVEP